MATEEESPVPLTSDDHLRLRVIPSEHTDSTEVPESKTFKDITEKGAEELIKFNAALMIESLNENPKT
jgi:hypothetical protein